MKRTALGRSVLVRRLATGVLLWLASLIPAFSGDPSITAVTPRDVSYVLDWDQANPPRDYHLIKGTVTVTRAAPYDGGLFRVQLSLIDDNDDAIALVSGSDVSDSWNGQAASHTFDFAVDPNEPLETDRRYRVRAKLQARVQLGSFWVWQNVISSPSVDSAERTFYHFTNTAGTDAAYNTLARIESLSISQNWRVRTATSTAQQNFRISTSTRFLRFDEMAAASATQQALDFHFRIYLVDDLGASQTLTIPDPQGHTHDKTLATWQAGKLPTDTVEDLSFDFKPSGQLDPVNRTYTLSVEVWTQPAPGQSPIRLSRRVNPAVALFDFNGTLRFGSEFTTTMLAAARTATPTIILPSYAAVEMSLGSVSKIAGDSVYSGNLGTQIVRLLSDGVATYNGVTPLTLTNQAGPTQWSNHAAWGIAYQVSPSITLGSGGGTAGVRIDPLPAGMGISKTTAAPVAGEILSTVLGTVSATPLDAAVAPISPVVWSFPSGVWVMEESKPLAVRATAITWQPGEGKLDLTADGSVHHPETAMRALLASAPGTIPADYRERRSNNDMWLLTTAIDTSPVPSIRGSSTTIVADAGANALATMDFTLSPGAFNSHFPEASITSSAIGGNRVYVVDDMIQTSVSGLDNVTIQMNYLRTDPLADPPSPSYHSTTLTPNGTTSRLTFTPTGGLRAVCSTGAGGHALRWGRLGDGRHAFSTDPFLTAAFFMPGTFYPMGFLADGDNDLGHQQCPVTLHLSGQVSNKWKFADLERPGNDAYKTNSLLADYAGMNLRVQNEAAGFEGRSIICGTEAPAYPLTAQSRYYARKGGVTGIHDAIGGPSGVSLFGFATTLTSYGLSFRDSLVKNSVCEGELEVPGPSDFTLPIEGLSFTASGQPNGGKPVVGGPLTLSYWQAEMVPMGMEFIPTDPNDLNKGVLAFESSVRLPSLGQGVVAYGKLGFHYTGNLVRPADNVPDVTSRLRAPNEITFNGPAKLNGDGTQADGFEIYRLTPVSDIYLNHYPGSGNPGDGFLNLAGTLNVAFFRTINVHVQASASPNAQSEVALLHLTGGWTTTDPGPPPRVLSFFTHASQFDPEHLGHPAGVSLNAYRTGADYRPRAMRSWFEGVDFDYPLVWDNTTRNFHTPEDFDGEVDLLVVNARHQLNSLSAELADLSFGATYDGIPKISVGNLLVNTAGDAVGAVAAIEDVLKKGVGNAVGEAAGGALWLASEASAGLLNDSLDPLFGATVDTILEVPVRDLVVDALMDPNNSNALRVESEWDAILQDELTSPTGAVRRALTDAAQLPPEDNASIIGEVQDAVDGMSGGLKVLIGDGGDRCVGGLLETDEAGNFVFGADLVFALIDRIASDEIKGLLGIKRGGDAEEFINQQTTALVNKHVPALVSIRARLIQIHARLQDIKAQFNPNQMLGEAIAAHFDRLEIDWGPAGDALGNLLLADLKEHLRNRYGGNRGAFAADANRLETSRFLIGRIRERLMAGALASRIQTLLRQQFQELQEIIDQTVGSVFSNVTNIIRGLVAEVTGRMDDNINKFTSELDVVEAADIQGSAIIRGDTLQKLRLDATLKLKLDEPIEFKGYLEINSLQAGTSDYGDAREIILGTDSFPIEFMDSTADFRIKARVILNESTVLGLGGEFVMLDGGRLEFEGFAITQLGAAIMFGVDENYLAAKLGMEFESFAVAGGLFVGHSNTLEPLKMVDPEVGEFLNYMEGPITGFYVYGEVFMPIVDLGCFFNVSAGLGVGAFYFTENNTIGGKIKAKVSGEALCVISVSGEVVLIGAKSDIMRFKGTGKIKGKIGPCPFCIKFSESVSFTYDENNGFDANF